MRVQREPDVLQPVSTAAVVGRHGVALTLDAYGALAHQTGAPRFHLTRGARLLHAHLHAITAAREERERGNSDKNNTICNFKIFFTGNLGNLYETLFAQSI